MIEKTVRVLLVSGRVIGEQYYPADNERIRRILESTGKFEVKVTEEFNGSTARTLEDYDVIFLNYDGRGRERAMEAGEYSDVEECYGAYERWDPETEKVFFDFVRNGGGVYVHHTSVDLAEDLPEEYYQLMGILNRKGRRKQLNVPDGLVIRFAEDTPFGRDLPTEFQVLEEDFWSNIALDPASEAEVVVSAYDSAAPWREIWDRIPEQEKEKLGAQRPEELENIDRWQPVVWTNRYGKGRVFVCEPGKDYETFNRLPYVTLLCRGVEWAASGSVTLNPPDTTSGNRKFRPWPYYDQLPEATKTFKDIISNYL
ncbi:MAG: ThuA domain-containing protein [Lachnospiraceae bacterium]|nr:ThuA domain-containing protein [Lachnospiraceae bacterium]